MQIMASIDGVPIAQPLRLKYAILALNGSGSRWEITYESDSRTRLWWEWGNRNPYRAMRAVVVTRDMVVLTIAR